MRFVEILVLMAIASRGPRVSHHPRFPHTNAYYLSGSCSLRRYASAALGFDYAARTQEIHLSATSLPPSKNTVALLQASIAAARR